MVKTILVVAISILVLAISGVAGYSYLVGNAQASNTEAQCQDNAQCPSGQMDPQDCNEMQNMHSTACAQSGMQGGMMQSGMMQNGMMDNGACQKNA